jgi:hypothetical protein
MSQKSTRSTGASKQLMIQDRQTFNELDNPFARKKGLPR